MEKRFDPMTGQPIQPQPVNEQPQMRFDPMTGQPIQPTPAPQPVPTPAPQFNLPGIRKMDKNIP